MEKERKLKKMLLCIVQWIKEEENICYGLVFKAADKFNSLYGRPPGIVFVCLFF